ncbi:DUF2971 domain-containing protein [Methylobacter sp. G7]|uniref:DUF2971 domain-containing protein n=1 Tax=Methylobacter sp. G7 TaxID=3230117 RepID=UPI003D803175
MLSRLETAKFVINPKNPRSLFKYRKFDQNALQNLINDKVWLAAPGSFNDPFDCQINIDRKHSDEEIQAYLNFNSESQGDTKRYTLEEIPKEREFYESELNRLDNGVRNAGIFSLSTTPFEPLMWAHYADEHRGFCIEYERSQDNDLNADNCFKVEYGKPIFPILRGLDYFKAPDDEVMKILTYKAKSWRYENEWRFVQMWKTPPELKERSYRLKAHILSISFGVRMQRREALTIIKIFRNDTRIKFYRMSIIPEQFALKAILYRFSAEEFDL